VRISVEFLTHPDFIRQCALWTSGKLADAPMDAKMLERYILAEHSPLRVFFLKIDMVGIPAYSVSVHFSRHKVGVEHFVTTHRPDRTGMERQITDIADHRMVLNYQALVNIARRRLCSKAAPETVAVMEAIKREFYQQSWMRYGANIAGVLARGLRPECVYRGGCPEFSSCGRMPLSALPD
jgi:hypothetical protein